MASLEWSVDEVVDWLGVNGLGEFQETFAENEIDGEALVELDNEFLKDMGISAAGKRLKLLKRVRTLKEAPSNEEVHTPPATTTTAPTAPSLQQHPPTSPGRPSPHLDTRTTPEVPCVAAPARNEVATDPSETSDKDTAPTIPNAKKPDLSNGAALVRPPPRSFRGEIKGASALPNNNRPLPSEQSHENLPARPASCTSIASNTSTSTKMSTTSAVSSTSSCDPTTSPGLSTGSVTPPTIEGAAPGEDAENGDAGLSVHSLTLTGEQSSSGRLLPRTNSRGSLRTAKPNKGLRDSAFGLLRKVRAKKSIKLAAGSHESVIMQGYLHKEGGSHKTWKRRWCVLADMALYYYKSPNDEEALGCIPLPGYVVERVQSTNPKFNHMFKISHANVRTWFFAADSEEEALEWCEPLRKIGRFEVCVPVDSVPYHTGDDKAPEYYVMTSNALVGAERKLSGDSSSSDWARDSVDITKVAPVSKVYDGLANPDELAAAYDPGYAGVDTPSRAEEGDHHNDDDSGSADYEDDEEGDGFGYSVGDGCGYGQEIVKVRALYDNVADEDDELGFNVDDEIAIHNREREDWWIGTLNGKTGFVYAAYVSIIT